MSDTPTTTFNPRRFRTTVPFYARYRLGYSDALVARALALAGLRPGDAAMDLGCGPGLLAIPLARLGMKVVAVDPEPNMLAACRAAAEEAGVAVDVRQGSSFDLPKDAGPFKLVTMGRSFHWMDREATLKTLDGIVAADGALAFFDDAHPRTAENMWRFKMREIGERYGRNSSPHLVQAQAKGYRSHHALLLDSPFARLETVGEVVRCEITADAIVGRAYSLSTSSPERLGEQATAFEADLRAALAGLSPEGKFTEIAELSALVARRSTSPSPPL